MSTTNKHCRRSNRYQYKRNQPSSPHNDEDDDILMISDEDNHGNNNCKSKNKNNQSKLIQCGACFRSFHTQAQCIVFQFLFISIHLLCPYHIE